MRVRRRGGLRAGIVLALAAAGLWLALSDSTTRQGLNYAVAVHPIPRYVKALDFVDRHLHYRLLAKEITGGRRGAQEQVLAIYDWTRSHIRQTPAEWPVVDDHVLHIIIRGHGTDDQQADVFTTLCTYAGVPAFWKIVKEPDSGRMIVLSMVKIEGAWRGFDVQRGIIFRDREGALAAVDELVEDPSLIDTAAGQVAPYGIPYQAFFAALGDVDVPRPLRSELQMPGPRLWYQARQMVMKAGAR